MPDGMTHGSLGALSGVAATLLIPDDLTADARLTIGVSALAAGYAGGRFPDLLEPALHAWHRAFFHSAATGAGVLLVAIRSLPVGIRELLQEATAARGRRVALPPDHQDVVGLYLAEYGRYVLVGLLIGLPAGYLSHLLADAGTARSLPLLGLGVRSN